MAPHRPGSNHVDLEAARRERDLRHALALDLRRQCEDAGISQAALARAAHLSTAQVSRLLSARELPSLRGLIALSVALDARIILRIDPVTGPRIHDRVQAPIVEALLRIIHPRWRRFLEVAVHRPARGVIDVVLHDPDAGKCHRRRNRITDPALRAAATMGERQGRFPPDRLGTPACICAGTSADGHAPADPGLVPGKPRSRLDAVDVLRDVLPRPNRRRLPRADHGGRTMAGVQPALGPRGRNEHRDPRRRGAAGASRSAADGRPRSVVVRPLMGRRGGVAVRALILEPTNAGRYDPPHARPRRALPVSGGDPQPRQRARRPRAGSTTSRICSLRSRRALDSTRTSSPSSAPCR